MTGEILHIERIMKLGICRPVNELQRAALTARAEALLAKLEGLLRRRNAPPGHQDER